ncbi:MAG: hypothetical protein J6V15_02720, partial [Clostridia bacterium]|nr:hypothetical protein [Clostridia bacterium]
MKKSLYITIGLVLCLLMLCTACGKDGTIDNNIDNTPDNTPVTDPDTTPPDSTGKPDDNQEAAIIQPPRGPQSGEYIPDEETMDANKGILWMYYDFIHNNRKAYLLDKGIDITFDELMTIGTAPADLSLMEYGFADYSVNGVLEMVLQDQNRNLPYYLVLFYNYGKLYI